MNLMKSFLKLTINKLLDFFDKIFSFTYFGKYLHEKTINGAMLKLRKITHNEIELLFTIPNSLNNWRAESFATKEPETLEWIDSLKEGSVVWDIGANIGLYSCYAAKKKNCKVFAFEPSIFNLELLARNIYINGLTDNIVIVPLPLTNKLSTSTLNMSSTMWGGALSTFGESYGQDGKTINKKFEFNTLGISMLDAVNLLKIPHC